jgi:hypothetical protein
VREAGKEPPADVQAGHAVVIVPPVLFLMVKIFTDPEACPETVKVELLVRRIIALLATERFNAIVPEVV